MTAAWVLGVLLAVVAQMRVLDTGQASTLGVFS
jgi:hypothetical protein